ncbi:MAG TPA: hypothetical protein VHA52_07870, partial [Candidatus Babeliaceae bacterium]|nr:hypothetical protein [Candidatus Babeliaceae bacterium]
NKKALDFLISTGISPNARITDACNFTLLAVSLTDKQELTLEYLLKKGADISKNLCRIAAKPILCML